MAYSTVITAVGRAKLQAAVVGGAPVTLAEMAIGDGGGDATTPDDAQTALVGEVYRALISSARVDPAYPDQVIVEAIIPASEGGYTIREVGIFDGDGDLVAVGNLPETLKPLPASGSARDLTILVHLALTSAEAAVVSIADSEAYVTVSALAAYATRDFVRSNADFFAVLSATTIAPPAAPAIGDAYLVPAGASGVWAAAAGKVASWRSAVDGWHLIAPRVGAQINAADTEATLIKTNAGWQEVANPAALYLHANFI